LFPHVANPNLSTRQFARFPIRQIPSSLTQPPNQTLNRAKFTLDLSPNPPLSLILLLQFHSKLAPSEAIAMAAEAGSRRGAAARRKAKEAVVGAAARVLFYPTLLYNVVRSKVQAEFRWWDEVDPVRYWFCPPPPWLLLVAS
jgi:hypothetical protein